MKKYFLILLFSVITFCAQSQVTIPDEIARFYLEQNEKAKLYEKQIVIKDEMISNQKQQLDTKDVIIETFKNDAMSYQGLIKTYKDRLNLRDKEIVIKDKEIKKAKRQRNIVAGAGGGAVVGSLFGQPLIGAAIGAGGGLIISWIKK